MPTPTLSPVDAFLIASQAAEVGVPLVDKELLESLASATKDDQDARLAPALRRAHNSLANYVPWADTAHQFLDQRAARFGLSLPARPQDALGYTAWLPMVLTVGRKAASATEDPAILAAFEAGVAAGELYFAMWTGKYLGELRMMLPDHALLQKRAGELAAALGDATGRLGAALRRPAIPTKVAPVASQLAELFQHLPDLTAVTTLASYLQLDEWMTRAGTQLDELVAAVRFPPERAPHRGRASAGQPDPRPSGR